ncbi:ABC transporter substrate-binding protein [Salinibacterium sp. CAN_S4]|uniref:ABC transporter substrate-binding protein n=1 Tax=Salinibacterium sp. CAN_S4 TaxID=2787727 RepID=UPI0018EFCB74
MKKSIAAVSVLAALTLVLAGCAPASESGTTEIRYQIQDPEDADSLALIQGSVDQFNDANPDIKVTLEAVPLDQQRTVLQTQLRSGEGPDVFQYDTGPGYAGALSEAGLLLDLTDAYTENSWPVYDFAKERVTFDGKVVGIPQELELLGVYYNMDILAASGLEAPASVDDLFTGGESLIGEGIIPFTFGDEPGWPAFHIFSMSLVSALGADKVQSLIDGESQWNEPEVVKVLDLVFKQFLDAGLYPPTPTALTYDDANSLFLSGQAAKNPTGSWLIADLADADFEIGFMPFPASDGPGAFTGGLGAGTFVSASTKAPEAAITFMSFLVSEERGRYEVETLQRIPAFPVDTAGIEISPLFANVIEEVNNFATGGAALGASIDVNMGDEFNKAMSDGIQALLTGSVTAQELADSLQAASEL